MASKTSLHVDADVRDRVNILKYRLGHENVNETVEFLLEGSEAKA